MANFQLGLWQVLKNEGGYVDHPYDNGGATNKGITLITYKKIKPDATKEDLKNISNQEIEIIYKEGYWDVCKGDLIKSQVVANKIFDVAVNSGPKQAIKFLQKTLNIVIFNAKPLVVDGIIGKNTIEAINLLDGEDVDNNIIQIYSLLQKEYYSKLVINNNSQLVFLKGWYNRADKLLI